MSAHDVLAALAQVAGRIDAVERAWNHDVEITAVTKAFPPEVIDLAVAAGCRAIGENYAQELVSKRDTLDAIAPSDRPRVDFIGRLQTNKVRQLVGIVDRWASVDRWSLAAEIAKRAPGARILIQVNSTGEADKGGCAPRDAAELVERCGAAGLFVDGLLTVGPTGATPDEAAPGFEVVRQLVDDFGLAVCSMGMTADLEVAVARGATSVRIGSALFGTRPPRDI